MTKHLLRTDVCDTHQRVEADIVADVRHGAPQVYKHQRHKRMKLLQHAHISRLDQAKGHN
jgi:hypothetical protein